MCAAVPLPGPLACSGRGAAPFRVAAPHACSVSLQVEMFLLAHAVRHTIRVYRLSKYSTEEFVTVYPTDPPRDWPVVTLIAEDDRHYNVPVRVCEETSL